MTKGERRVPIHLASGTDTRQTWLPVLEDDIRNFLFELMPPEHAPAHVRLAFHDAGTFDQRTRTGGANGSIRLTDEVRRAENTGWGQECLALLNEARQRFPDVSWADLVAVGAAAAIARCGGPTISVGLGRSDATEPAPAHRLPGGYEGPALLRTLFGRMGFSARELVALAGAHTLGHTQRVAFTDEPWVFSNAYYGELLEHHGGRFPPSDNGLLEDPELRGYVEQYARDEPRFFADFADAFRRLTWLGSTLR
jgi:L-ascorbate peroxidase